MPSKDNEQTDQQLTEKIQDQIEDYFEEYMRPLFERIATDVSEKVFKERFSQFQGAQVDLSTDVKTCPSNPPLPETIPGTRKHVVPREKLSGTVDAALLKLFEDERRERGYNVSRMLDVVLWNYFTITKPKHTKPVSGGPEVSSEAE
jgi:hypothetical protein